MVCRDLSPQKGDRLYHEPKALCDCVEFARKYDQPNLGSMASLEAVVRRRILSLIEARSEGVDSSSWQLARQIAGGRSGLDVLSKEFRLEVTRMA